MENSKLRELSARELVEVARKCMSSDSCAFCIMDGDDSCTRHLIMMLADKLEELEKEVERLTHILHSYALQYGTVSDKQKVIDKAKAEVAVEIFEEIEKHECCNLFGKTNLYLLTTEAFAELKKKYTEDKG